MAHPQSSPRGLFAKGAILMGSTGLFSSNFSEGTAIIASNSTGIVNFGVGLSPSGDANAQITGNSTGAIVAGSVFPSGGAIGATANSTGIVVPVLYIGAMALAANSTGVTIAGAQISTA